MSLMNHILLSEDGANKKISRSLNQITARWVFLGRVAGQLSTAFRRWVTYQRFIAWAVINPNKYINKSDKPAQRK